jgi:hypothetical protein
VGFRRGPLEIFFELFYFIKIFIVGFIHFFVYISLVGFCNPDLGFFLAIFEVYVDMYEDLGKLHKKINS